MWRNWSTRTTQNRVEVTPCGFKSHHAHRNNAVAYIIGVSLGDGNLSNPNGRALRLRITCDKNYPNLINYISLKIRNIFPDNKVSLTRRSDNCVDISCYSNNWLKVLGWKDTGSKKAQDVHIPKWVYTKKSYLASCLLGLLQTDGSIYTDRGYIMVNFTNELESLSLSVFDIIHKFGYKPHIYKHTNKRHGRTKYTVRLSRDVQDFIKQINLWKN